MVETVINAVPIATRLQPLPFRSPVSQARAKFRLLLASIFLLMFSAVIASAQSQDPMKQHYEAAGMFIQSGDRDRASAEYQGFLAQALRRIANGKADVGQFDAAVPLYEEALAFSPNDLDLRVDFANACFDADKLLRARSLAEAVASSPSANRTARLLLGRVLFHLGEFEPARQQLEKVFAEKPEFNVGYLLAKIYLLLHQEQTAHALLQGMAENFGDTAENHVYFGRAYSETDHPEEAIVEFRRAMAKDEHAPDAHYYLGLTYLGHNEAAGYAQAIPEFRAELQLNQNDYRSHYMLGYVALKQRNFPEAERELASTLAAAPRDLQSLLQLAEVYTDTNRLPEAEKALRKAISIATDNSGSEGQASRVHYLLGRILEQTGRQPEAAQEMKIVADIQRRLGPSSMQTAGAGTTAGTTKEAKDEPRENHGPPERLAQLARFVNGLKPAIADAYNNLGAISAGGHDFTAAAKYFQRAGEWDGSLLGLDRNLGMAWFYSGQYADAVPPLRRHLQTQPKDLPGRSMLALSLYKTGDFRGVIETLRPVSTQISGDGSLASAYANSYYQLGKLQLEAGQTDAAIATLEAGTKLSPQNPAFHNQLAVAYRRAGREAEAQREETTLRRLRGGQMQ